ncbi:D-alanine--D-alanine ligase [bacterium]|nr:D-alanine--D-alanine ligase [bacterium]
MRILVLFGGDSSERNVSYASGDAVAKWLMEAGHEVVKYDPENPDVVHPGEVAVSGSEVGLDAPDYEVKRAFEPNKIETMLEVMRRERIEFVFQIIHGGYGENGVLQGVLEWSGMPFAGSSSLSCALAMNKPTSRTLMQSAAIPVAEGFELNEEQLRDTGFVEYKIGRTLGFPSVIKPANGGSTVGLSIVRSADEVAEAVKQILDQHDSALIETYFSGREIAATVIDGKCLPLIEIRPKSGFYDYTNKYTAGRTDYLCPAPIDPDLANRIGRAAESVFAALRCRGFARVDFLARDNEFICLELNALPGMTATSLVPKAAAAVGWSPVELMSRIIECSLRLQTQSAQ